MARGSSSSSRRSSSPAPARTAAPSRSYSSAPAPAAKAAPAAAPAHAPTHASHPPAQQAHAAPPMQQQQSGGGGMLSGLAGTVMSGMAFGTGSAMANRAVDAVMGPRTVEHVHQPAAAAAAAPRGCVDQNNKFQACVRDNAGSIASCQYLLDVLSQCQREEQQ